MATNIAMANTNIDNIIVEYSNLEINNNLSIDELEFLKQNSFDYIIYHENCPDGIAGYWCIKHYNSNATNISCIAGKNPFQLHEIKNKFTDKNIIYVDISPTVDFLNELIEYANQIWILDHHKTVYDIIDSPDLIKNSNKLHTVIDMKRAGSHIAWDVFNKNTLRPWFIQYIGNRDLWDFSLPYTKEIMHTLFYKNININYLDELYKLYENKIDTQKYIKHSIEIGTIIDELNKKEINNIINKANIAIFEFGEIKYNVWIVDCGDKPELRSEIGNILTNKKYSDNKLPDFAVLYKYNIITNEWFISLRGGNHSPDLTQIAKKYGGGGHPKASGMTLDNIKNPLLNVFNIIK